MILRVFHGLPGPGGEDALVNAIREHATPTLERLPSLTGFQLGIRHGEAGEIVIVTTWTDFGAILASGDVLVDAPRAIGGAPSLFATGHADHYELVIGDESGGPPIPDARMRVTNVMIKPGREASYFQAVTPVAARLMAGGMVMHLLGRRIVADHTEVCAVTLWQGDAPSGAHGVEGPILPGTEELSDFYAAPPVARVYEPIIQTAVGRGSRV